MGPCMAVFHLGAYDPGSVPKDQASLTQHHCQTISALYLRAGGSIDDLLKLLDGIGDAYVATPVRESKTRFKSAAIDVGLVRRN